MKLAISVTEPTLDAAFDPRFGRAAFFCLVDSDSGTWTAYANPSLSAASGAGVQAAQFVATLGAKVVVSGAFGPKADATLGGAGIRRLLAPAHEGRRAADILAAFRAGELAEAATDGPTGRSGG